MTILLSGSSCILGRILLWQLKTQLNPRLPGQTKPTLQGALVLFDGNSSVLGGESEDSVITVEEPPTGYAQPQKSGVRNNEDELLWSILQLRKAALATFENGCAGVGVRLACR